MRRGTDSQDSMGFMVFYSTAGLGEQGAELPGEREECSFPQWWGWVHQVCMQCQHSSSFSSNMYSLWYIFLPQWSFFKNWMCDSEIGGSRSQPSCPPGRVPGSLWPKINIWGFLGWFVFTSDVECSLCLAKVTTHKRRNVLRVYKALMSQL